MTQKPMDQIVIELKALSLEDDMVDYIVQIIAEGDRDTILESVPPLLSASGMSDQETVDLCEKFLTSLGMIKKESEKRQINLTMATMNNEPTHPVQPPPSNTNPKTKETSQTVKGESQPSPAMDFLTGKNSDKIEATAHSKNNRFAAEHERILNAKDIHLRGVYINVGDQTILENSVLAIDHGRKYGLIGRNGVGKTTLLRHMATGKISGFPPRIRVLHVEQEASSISSMSILDTVLKSDQGAESLKDRLSQLEESPEENSEEIFELYNELDLLDDASVSQQKATSILVGLGFKKKDVSTKTTSELSGGWRMKVALACALFSKPDLLLLDEPTNHLDLKSVLWLGRWIRDFDGTAIIVSHDRAFLNQIVTDVLYFNNKKLHVQSGDFDAFQKRKDERITWQKNEAEKEDKEKARLKNSIEKYKQKSRGKDGRAAMPMVGAMNSKLRKMDDHHKIVKASWRTIWNNGWKWGFDMFVVEAEEGNEREFRFQFPDPDHVTDGPLLQMSDVTAGYEKKTLFRGVNLDVRMNSRIVILGPNGIGKSTLFKTIAGTLEPKSGEIYRHRNLKIGFFDQHDVDHLPSDGTPLSLMRSHFPQESEDTLRGHLGSFGMGKLAVKQIKSLSGGQKARVVLAKITWDRPHILLLDEPSNHLDFQSVDALIKGIQNFSGGVVMASHDQHFITGFSDQKILMTIFDEKLQEYEGTFEDYVDEMSPEEE